MWISLLIEFTTTQLKISTAMQVTLQVIDVHGNITRQTYPIRTGDIAQVDVNKDCVVDVDDLVLVASKLGQQPAGIYNSRSRAAYWDGRNELGEPVASGAYFYTLSAGNFTATRKMLIRK